MAIFVDHRVQAPYPGQNRDIQWHKTQGLLAVGSFNETTGAAVTVYQEEVVFFSLHIFCQGGTVVQWVERWTLQSVGRGFKSYSRQRCVTTLGKLFTPMCLCHQAV